MKKNEEFSGQVWWNAFLFNIYIYIYWLSIRYDMVVSWFSVMLLGWYFFQLVYSVNQKKRKKKKNTRDSGWVTLDRDHKRARIGTRSTRSTRDRKPNHVWIRENLLWSSSSGRADDLIRSEQTCISSTMLHCVQVSYIYNISLRTRNLVSFERSLRRIKLICPSTTSHYPLYILHRSFISPENITRKLDNDVQNNYDKKI